MENHKVSFSRDPPEVKYFDNHRNSNSNKHNLDDDEPKSILKSNGENGKSFFKDIIIKNKRQIIIASLNSAITCLIVSYVSGDKLLSNKKKYLNLFIAVFIATIVSRLIITKIIKIG